MTSSLLFGRQWRVTVGTPGSKGLALQLTDIDIEFEIKKTLKPEPSTCDLKIFNLTAAHRKQIEQNPALNALQKIPVKIEAGYVSSGMAQIFLGELRAGWTVTDGADLVTELSNGDGEKEMATARMNVSFGGSTPIGVALTEIITTLGVGQGNVQQAVSLLQAKGLVQFSTKTVVLKGNAANHLTDFCKSCGLEWSVQDGNVQILQLGQPLAGQSYSISSATGLIGSPSVDSKGILTFDTLLIPGIKPGVVVQMNSVHVTGGYRVETCEYNGNTMTDDWQIKCSASKY
jgi:hypothetical protein